MNVTFGQVKHPSLNAAQLRNQPPVKNNDLQQCKDSPVSMKPQLAHDTVSFGASCCS